MRSSEGCSAVLVLGVGLRGCPGNGQVPTRLFLSRRSLYSHVRLIRGCQIPLPGGFPFDTATLSTVCRSNNQLVLLLLLLLLLLRRRSYLCVYSLLCPLTCLSNHRNTPTNLQFELGSLNLRQKIQNSSSRIYDATFCVNTSARSQVSAETEARVELSPASDSSSSSTS